MKNKYKLSVIVPIYNSKNTIDKLLNVLSAIRDETIEVIIIDNNSTDGTYEILQESKSKHKFKLLSEKIQGPMNARLRGFIESSGEYILFTDADDEIIQNLGWIVNNIIEKYKFEIYIFDYFEIANNQAIYKQGCQSKKLKINVSEALLSKPALWNKIFKRSKLDKQYFINSIIGEDMCLTLLTIMKSREIAYISRPLLKYYLTDNGLSYNLSLKHCEDFIYSCNKILEFSKKEKYYGKFKFEINFILKSHVLFRIMRLACIKDKELKKDCYDKYIDFSKTIRVNDNPIFKRKYHYRFANFIFEKKMFFFNPLITFSINKLFTNKMLNNLFKKLDK